MSPSHEIRTLSLDVGNTLISMDFARIACDMEQRGFETEPEGLRRAEAKARSGHSSRMVSSPAKLDYSFKGYLEDFLVNIQFPAETRAEEIPSLAADLAQSLENPGQANRIWCWVVPEALSDFCSLGIWLVALSNSDGTAKLTLKQANLRKYFSTITDSTIVGYEKLDRRIFEHALAESDSQKHTTLYVGDLYYIDIQSARNTGLYALLDPFDDWQVEDDASLPDLSALEKILLGAQNA